MFNNIKLSFFLIFIILNSCYAQDYWEYYGEKEGLSDANVTCFLRDKHNFLWIGTENGLNRWDGLHFEIFLPQNRNKNTLSDAFITSLAQDKSGNIWIATHKGLNIYHYDTQQFSHIFHHDSVSFTLPNNWINALLIDSKEQIWVACDNRDLVYYDTKKKQFIPVFWKKYCENLPQIKEDKRYLSILYIQQKNLQTLYLYTNVGLFSFDINTYTSTFLEKKTVYLDSLIQYQDNQGLLWKKTTKGFAKWDAYLQHFEPIKAYTLPVSISNTPLVFNDKNIYITDQIKDDKDNIWIGTDQEGLYKWNPFTKEIYHFEEKRDNFLSSDISDLFWDSVKKVLWIATWDYGLYQYNSNTQKFHLFQYEEKDTASFSAFICHQIAQDSKGNIWIATEPGGISIFDYKTNKFKHLSIENGLPSNTIFGIVADKHGKMWISTSKGIAKIDPISYQVRVYTEKDGIPANIDLKNGLYIDKTAYISLFNYEKKESQKVKQIYGFRFLPENLDVPFFNTEIYLTDFQIFDKSYFVKEPAHLQTKIELNYDQNAFSFYFTSADLHRTELHTYFYQLQGYDNEWKKTTQNVAKYDHIPHGSYTFIIKTCNAEGIENPNIKTIFLTIKPPFWQTIWFRILIVSSLIGIIFALYKWRVSQISKTISLQKEKETLKVSLEKQLAEQKMSALRAQMNPHFIFNVMSSISNFIIYKETEKALDFLQTFSLLIRRVLEQSRTDYISLQEELETTKMFLAIEQQRFQGKFLYFIEIDKNIDIDFIEVPPMLLQPYIENAIWHGLMHKENEDRKLWLRVLQVGKTLHIEIEDNGIGRAKATELKSKKANPHKSFGMKVTDERLELLNKISQGYQWKIEIKDLYNEVGEATGTRVLLWIEANIN